MVLGKGTKFLMWVKSKYNFKTFWMCFFAISNHFYNEHIIICLQNNNMLLVVLEMRKMKFFHFDHSNLKQGKLGILMLQLLWGWFSQCVCHYAPLTMWGWENFFQQMEVIIIKWVNDYLKQLMLVPIMLQCLWRTAWGTLLQFETGGARAAGCETSKWIDLLPASVSLFVIRVTASRNGWEHYGYHISLAKSSPNWAVVWVPRNLGLRQRLPCTFFIAHVTPGRWMRDGGATQGKSRHRQGSYCLALPFSADENTKHPANVAFQIHSKGFFDCKYIPCNIWDILRVKHALLFTWNSKLTGSPVFYVQLEASSSGTEKSYEICVGTEPVVPSPPLVKVNVPCRSELAKLFWVNEELNSGLSVFPWLSSVRSEPKVRCQVGPVWGWPEAAVTRHMTGKGVQEMFITDGEV